MQLLIEKITNLFTWSEDHPASAMTVLLGVSLVIKAIVIFQTEIINTDGIRYINSAHELFQGNVAAAFAHEKMLGFTFLLGLTHLVIPDWFLAGKVLSCVALILTTIPLYLIAQELFGTRAALCTALVYTVAPTINGKCEDVIKDPTYLFLTILSLWVIFYAFRESRWGSFLLAGFLVCLSILIRPEGLVFFTVITLFLVVSAALKPDGRSFLLKSLLAFWALPFAGVLIGIVALVAGLLPSELLMTVYKRFAYYVQVDFLSIYKDIYQHLRDVEESFQGGQWTNDFFEYARYNIFIIYLLGMIQTFAKSIFPLFLIPLFFGLNLRRRLNEKTLLLLVVIVCFFLVDYLYLVSHNFLSARYLLVLVVLSFILVGYGMDRMLTAVETYQRRKTIVAVALVLCVLLPLGKIFLDDSTEKSEIKEAGIWLSEHKELTVDRVLVSEERIAFYAGLFRGDYVTFPRGDMDLLEQKALREDCEFLVLYQDSASLTPPPVLKSYAPIEQFSGQKKVAIIYERKS